MNFESKTIMIKIFLFDDFSQMIGYITDIQLLRGKYIDNMLYSIKFKYVVHESELIHLPYPFSHSLHYFSFSNSFFSLSYFIPFSTRFLSHFPHLLLHSFRLSPPLPHHLHQSLITSLVIHSLPLFLSSCLFLLFHLI